MMVAEDASGRIVACGSVGVPYRPRMSHSGGMVPSVLRSHWGRGIGPALFAELVRQASDAGIEWLSLSVREDNARARPLYEAAGFAYCGRETGGMAVGDERYDMLLMEKALP